MITATIEGYILRGDLKHYGHYEAGDYDDENPTVVPFDEEDLGTLERDIFFNLEEPLVKGWVARSCYEGTDADLLHVIVNVVIDEVAREEPQ